MPSRSDGRLDLGFGTLNKIEQQNSGKVFDPRTTTGFNALRQVTADQYKKNSLSNTGPYRGIVLRVELNPPENLAAGWLQRLNVMSKPRMTLKVRIPELHAMLLEPANYGTSNGNDNYIIDMYPSFVPATEEANNKPPNPGDIVNVDFGNRTNMTDPIYLGISLEYAQGGAVGRSPIKDNFDDVRFPFGVLPPLGDNPVTGEGSLNNQLPFASSLIPNTAFQTIDDFRPQKEHVEVPSGMPPMRPPEKAYKNGSPIGTIDLVEIKSPYASKPGIFIAKSQEKAFYDLVSAAEKDGIRIVLNSGFRSFAQQKYLYDKYVNGNGNLAASPGFSLHQSGEAFDFNTGGWNTKTYDWLASNAHKFGFYNAGRFFKEAEQWHWIYKGANDPEVVNEGRVPLSEKKRSFT